MSRQDSQQMVTSSRGRLAPHIPPAILPVLLILLGTLFYWVGLPPLRQPWAGYVSAFFFSAAVYAPVEPTRKTFWMIWGVSLLCWLGLLQGIRLAYWPLYGGWIALSVYVSLYIPFYYFTARSLRRNFAIPFPFACSIAWVGFELFRGYFATGFSSCMLGHTQTPWPVMLQSAAHFGMYGVSFGVMLVGASLCLIVARICERNCTDRPLRTLVEGIGFWVALAMCTVWLGGSYYSYSSFEAKIEESQPIKSLGKFLLVQSNMPTQFDADYEQMIDWLQKSWLEHARLSRLGIAGEASVGVDVVLWPESTFGGGMPYSWIDWDGSEPIPEEFKMDVREFKSNYEAVVQSVQSKLNRLVVSGEMQPNYLVGGDVIRVHGGKLERFNAALWIRPNSDKVEYYAKRHLVMFGEYIPLVSQFPELLAIFGMGPIAQGDRFQAWENRAGRVLAPSICFEDVVPHFVQSQIYDLTQQGRSPDLLVNVTNDAWFRGSSILDHHLNSAIGCAVENRRPLLIAANSGISAWIDGSGNVVRMIPRKEEGTMIAEPIPDGRWGLWQSIGDWPARIACFIALLPACLAIVKWGIRPGKEKGPSELLGDTPVG